MSITKYFNLSVRWIGGNLASGMRQSGEQFHGMIERERADIARLNQSLVQLRAQEKTVADQVNASAEARKKAVADAKKNVADERRALTGLSDQIAKLRAAPGGGRGATPAWENWSAGLKQLQKDLTATSNATKAFMIDGAKQIAAAESNALRSTKKLSTAASKAQADALSTGNAARASQLVAEVAEAKYWALREPWNRDRIRQRGYHREVQAFKALQAQQSALEAEQAQHRTQRQAAESLPSKERRAAITQLNQRKNEIPRALAEVQERINAQRESAELAAARLELARAERRLTTQERWDARKAARAAAAEHRPLRTAATAAEAKATAATQAHDAAVAAGAASVQAAKDAVMRETATRVNTQQIHQAAYDAAKNAEPPKTAVQELRQRIANSKLPGGALFKAQEALNSILGTPDVNTAAHQVKLASVQAEIAARNADIKAINEGVKQRRLEAAQMQQTRQAIKQQVWRSLFEAAMKFTFVLGYLKRVMSSAATAAMFHYRAQGLTSLLGGSGTKNTGGGIFAQYANRSQYQAEVSPTDAMSRMGDLASAGYSRAEIGPATEAIFNTLLAARGEVTTSGAFDLGISLDKAFGGGGQDMATLLDTVVMSANKFPMTVGKVRDALSYATEAAVTYGQSLEETLLTIGLVMPIAKTPSKAGTITRNMMMSLAKPKGLSLLAEYNVKPKDENDRMRPVLDVYLELDEKFAEANALALERNAKRRADLGAAAAGRQALAKLPKKQQTLVRQALTDSITDAVAQMLGDPSKKGQLDTLLAANLGPTQLAAAAKRLLDEEKIADLKMGREKLWFQMTGQRGGAGQAGIDRSVLMGQAALRGTEFEGHRIASKRDAIEILRSSISDAAGETRRMSDEMRKTSYMIGVSFKASVERASIAFGTMILPVRDMMQQLGKTTLDWLSRLTSSDYGKPGGSPPGSSLTGNVVGVVAVLSGLVTSFLSLKTIIGTLLSLRTLTSAAMTAEVGRLTAGGMALGQAMAEARNSTQVLGVAGRTLASNFVQTGLKAVGWATVVGMAVVGIKLALDSASNAITDYTHVTERKRSDRVSRSENVLKTLMTAASEGRLGLKTREDGRGVITGLNENELKLIKNNPVMGATVASILAMQATGKGGAGEDAGDVVDLVYGQLRKEIVRGYARDPEARDKALKDLDASKANFLADYGSDAISAIAEQNLARAGASGNPERLVTAEAVLKLVRARKLEQELNPIGNYGLERGGDQSALVWDYLNSGKKPDGSPYQNVQEADKYADMTTKMWFWTQMDHRLAKEEGAAFPWLNALFSNASTAKVYDPQTNIPTDRRQFTRDGINLRGMGAQNNVVVSLDKNVSATTGLATQMNTVGTSLKAYTESLIALTNKLIVQQNPAPAPNTVPSWASPDRPPF